MSVDECRKCGGTMSGPVYCQGGPWCVHRVNGSCGMWVDHLAFTCARCGYVETRRTREQAQYEASQASPPQEEP
jgi:hypothetical protein